LVAFLLLGLVPSAALAQSEQAGSVDDPAAPAAASEDTNTPDIVVEGEVPEERRRVCEMQTTTGSIMPKRVCRTVAQIEEDERIARESLEIIKRDRDSRAFTQASRENR
jgi:hypothetical protein